MTVKRLTEILNMYNPDYEVVIKTIVDNGIVDINHVRCGILFSEVHGVVIYPKDQ